MIHLLFPTFAHASWNLEGATALWWMLLSIPVLVGWIGFAGFRIYQRQKPAGALVRELVLWLIGLEAFALAVGFMFALAGS